MPDIIRFVLSNAAYGFVVGLACAGVLFFADVGGIRSLVLASDIGPAVFALFTFKMGLTCAAAQIGFACFGNGADQDRT
ncbi:MAG: hypothetical protein AAF661_07685 [Pseudomonadota bacterium]